MRTIGGVFVDDLQWAAVVYRHRKTADDGRETEYATDKDSTIDYYYRETKPIGIVKYIYIYATRRLDKDNFFFTVLVTKTDVFEFTAKTRRRSQSHS